MGICRERGFSAGQVAETVPRQLADLATARLLPDLPPSARRATSSVTIDDTYMMQLMGLAPAEEEHRHSIAKGPGLYSGYGYTPRDGSVPVLLFIFFSFFSFLVFQTARRVCIYKNREMGLKPRDGSVYIYILHMPFCLPFVFVLRGGPY